MSTRLLAVLVFAAFAASISLVTDLATPAQAQSDEVCQEGTLDFCESTCGEDHEGVQITEVCATYNGQTSCECCCYYEYLN
jgi:hypothetical protein